MSKRKLYSIWLCTLLIVMINACGSTQTSSSNSRNMEAGTKETMAQQSSGISTADTELTEEPSSAAGKKDEPQQIQCIGYTGYLDECTWWFGYENFIDCDYDKDGWVDRVYREDAGEQCSYRIEFGNGDILHINNAGSGIPEIRSADLNGQEGQEILFTQSYGFSTNPQAFGELAVFEKSADGYHRVELPLSKGSGEYEVGLTCHYQQTGERSFRITCEEALLEAEVAVSEDQQLQWTGNADHAYPWDISLQPVYEAEIISDETGTRLICHTGVFDKWSADEILAAIVFCDGAWIIERLQYIRHYVEYIPISLEEGKEYQLQLFGTEEAGSNISQIMAIEVYWIHDNAAECIQNLDLSQMEIRTSKRGESITVGDFNNDGYEDFSLQILDQAGKEAVYTFIWDFETAGFSANSN